MRLIFPNDLAIFFKSILANFWDPPRIWLCVKRYRKFLHSFSNTIFGKYHSKCDFHCRKSSGMLSSLRQRQQDHKPLPHLHSIVFNGRNSPVFIVSEKPTIYLLSSIVRFFNTNIKNTKIPIGSGDWLNDELIVYIEKFAGNTSWSFSMNWFLRREVTFVLDLLRSTAFQQRIDKRLQLMVAYKILCCLDDTQLNDILHIFSRFIFNIDLYEHKMNVTSMDEWKSLYAKVCVEHFLNSLNGEVSALLCRYCLPAENSISFCFESQMQGAPSQSFYEKMPMLSTDWPCMLLLKMYKTPDSFRGKSIYLWWNERIIQLNFISCNISAFSVPERDTICTTLSFLLLQNANDVKILTKTEQFLYTMIAFLGKGNTFLDADVNQLLGQFVRDTFTDPKVFDFDAKLNRNFHFYLQFSSIASHSHQFCSIFQFHCREIQLWKFVHFIFGSIPRLQLRWQDVRCASDGAVGPKAQYQMATHAVVGTCARVAIRRLHWRWGMNFKHLRSVSYTKRQRNLPWLKRTFFINAGSLKPSFKIRSHS